MSMKLLSKENETSRVLIKDSNPTEMNTFRRVIINKVPTMTIHEIEVKENSSAMYVEMLAHRLGLTPLKTDLKSYELQKDCKCKGKGCARCTLKMTLKMEGPCTVYAEDIKSQDPKVVPVYPRMQILELLEGQKIDIVATATLGEGKNHMKNSPGLIFYQGNPEIKIGAVKNPKVIVDTCPKHLYKLDGQKLKCTDNTKCVLCKACEDVSQGTIQVNGSDKDFILTIEEFGQLPAKQMVTKASEIISKQLTELTKAIKAKK